MEKPNFVDFGLIFKAENFFLPSSKTPSREELDLEFGRLPKPAGHPPEKQLAGEAARRRREGASLGEGVDADEQAHARLAHPIRRRQQPRVRARARVFYRWWWRGFFLFFLFL